MDADKSVKLNADVLIKRLEEHLAIIKEEREKLRANGDSVEVIIKVKKKKDKDGCHKHRRDYDVQAVVHRAGSWGDLLLKKKQATESRNGVTSGGDGTTGRSAAKKKHTTNSGDDKNTIVAQLGDGAVRSANRKSRSKYEVEHRRTFKVHHAKCARNGIEGVQVQVPGMGGGPERCCNACTCHQLRLKDQESQTTMYQPDPVPASTTVSPPIQEEVPPARQNLPEAIKPKISHSAPDKSRPPPRRLSTSRRSANIPITRVEDAQVQTKERTIIQDEVDHAAMLRDLKKLNDLEMENALLKQNSAALVEQVNKAKTEKQEYITTIKELYELAEVLRHENVILIGTHEEHRSLQEKLIEALGENQVLKQHLEELASKITQPADKSKESEIKDFWKVRDVLKEVKTVIAEEINGLQKVNGTKSPVQADMSDILELFDRAKESNNGMNDTNFQCDDEIQKILNISKEIADRSDIRSSTQYLEVEESHIVGSSRRFVPSPSPSSHSSL